MGSGRWFGLVLAFDLFLTMPVTRVDLAGKGFETDESVRTLNMSDFVLDSIRECSIK